MTPIRWAALASRDLDKVKAWYREIDHALAQTIIDRIVNATRLLRDHPEAGPIELYGSRRKRRVAGTPYILFYRVAGDHVRILRVLHTAQDQRRH